MPRRYEDWEKAQAVTLAAELKSVRGAAIRLKIPIATIRQWIRLAAARQAVEGAEPTPVAQAAVEYLMAAAENVRLGDPDQTVAESEATGNNAGTLTGWRGWGAERRRIEALVQGWIRQQEEAQVTASVLLEAIRLASSPVKPDDLKALAVALRSSSEAGEKGASAHLDYAQGRVGQRRDGALTDARSYTINQVWAGIHEERDRALRAGRPVDVPPAPIAPPPGLLATPYPTHTPDPDPLDG